MRGKRKLFKFGIFLLVISISCIGSGIFIGYLSKPERLISNAMKNLSSSAYKNKEKQENNTTSIENSKVTINSNITVNVNSQNLTEKIATDINALKYHNFLKNITNLETNIKFSQDLKNEKLLLQVDKYLYNQPFMRKKHLIVDATEYQYIPDLNNNYINYGNNNYFENPKLNQEYSIKNAYQEIIELLKNNIKKDYYKTSREETIISGKKYYTNKITLSVNNKIKKELIYKLTTYLEENIFFKSISITEKEIPTIINNIANENDFIFNIYTDKIGYKNLKYELIIINKNNNINLIYEPTTNKGYIEINNKLIYKFSITENETRTKIYIMNPNNKKVGSLIIEENEIVFNFDNDNINSYGLYKKEETNIDKTLNVLESINLRITNKTTELINLNIKIDNTISNNSKIEEDVSSSVFRSSITLSEEELYNSKMNDKRNILYQ